MNSYKREYFRAHEQLRIETATPCPRSIGDKIRFKPAAFAGTTTGYGVDLPVEVTGTVIQIHTEHRWYRVQYELQPGCIGRECFKY